MTLDNTRDALVWVACWRQIVNQKKVLTSCVVKEMVNAAAVNQQIMDACGKLLSTKEASRLQFLYHYMEMSGKPSGSKLI